MMTSLGSVLQFFGVMIYEDPVEMISISDERPAPLTGIDGGAAFEVRIKCAGTFTQIPGYPVR